MQIDRMWPGRGLEGLQAEQCRERMGLRQEQQELVERLLLGERVLAIQPSGWGTERCYQVASFYLPHLTLVFSPLRTALRDQYQGCRDSCDIPCALVSADRSLEENRSALTQALAGRIKILFLALGRLDNTGWQRYIPKMKISLLVIEEAHCTSTYSYDFQPHYQHVAEVVGRLALTIPALMLTEAANKQVERDILQRFCAARVIRSSLWQTNLRLYVIRLNGDWEKLCYLATALQQFGDTGIIYTATQGSAMMIAHFLCGQGIKALHTRTNNDDILQSSHACIGTRYSVLCMAPDQNSAVDMPNIHFVVHYHTPATLSDYHQCISRVSQHDKRDRDVQCVLLYDPADLLEHEQRVEQDEPQERQYVEVLSLLRIHSQGTHEQNLLLNTGLSRPRLYSILEDLREQEIVTFNEDRCRYALSSETLPAQLPVYMYGLVDFSIHEQRRRRKLEELVALRQYTCTAHCYMSYLSNYLADEAGSHKRCGVCGNCSQWQFPDPHPAQRIQTAVTQFLEKDFLPRIEQQNGEVGRIHEAGWSLSYQTGSRIGKQIYASKYQGAGPFPLGLVLRAAEIARTRYPTRLFHAVVSVPASESSPLVEMFARQVAERLGTLYFPGLVKIRPTYVQRRLSNWARKANNVRGVFAVIEPEKIMHQTLLLIDDIYDSGCTLFEASKTLMEAGAQAVYPLTITRTLQADYEQGEML